MNKKQLKIKCQYCGKYFIIFFCRKNTAKFCSISCSKKYMWKNPKFKEKMSVKSKGKHYSPKTEFKKRNHYNIKTEFKKGQHPSRKTEFKKGHKHRYFGIKSKNHPAFIDGRTNAKHFCLDCGKKITSIYSKRCKLCGNKIISKKLKGKNNGQYIDGLSSEPYSLNWTKTLREYIRNRDHYTCQICGCSQLENGRQLCVHHIDYDKDNLEPNNLISLCNCCHTKTNYNRDYWYAYIMYITNQEIL